MAYLFFDALAVDARDDVQVGTAVEGQVTAGIHLGGHQTHVGAGLQLYAVIALQLCTALLALGGRALAAVGLAGDEQNLFLPVFTVVGDVLAGIGIENEGFAGLGLDAVGLAVDRAQRQVIGGGEQQFTLLGVQFTWTVGSTVDPQRAG